MVEMAVVLVVFLTMFMGIIEYGRYYFLVQVANNAVREGQDMRWFIQAMAQPPRK